MGMKASSRRATFQLLTKAMTSPPKKVATNCMKRDSLSPMPSWILSKSLHGREGGHDIREGKGIEGGGGGGDIAPDPYT